MNTAPRPRSILHIDLDPFFVSVERSLDSSLRGRPVIVGGDAMGVVAAASTEAREAGVRPGQPLGLAKRLCPEAAVRPGDLEAYARVSEQVTSLLLSRSRRVERPSADEAYVDLTPDSSLSPNPSSQVDGIRDEIQRRLGLDASLGLASSRLAARVASRWARPRGFLLVLPGYEESFLARQPVNVLPDLPPHIENALAKAGLTTLGHILWTDDPALEAAVGPAVAQHLRDAARGGGEDPVAVTAPPTWVQEEAPIRDRRADRDALLEILEGLATRACRRIRPYDLGAETVTVEVHRRDTSLRRTESVVPGITDEETACRVARSLAEPILEPTSAVRALEVRLSRLVRPRPQAPLFPDLRRTGAL